MYIYILFFTVLAAGLTRKSEVCVSWPSQYLLLL